MLYWDSKHPCSHWPANKDSIGLNVSELSSLVGTLPQYRFPFLESQAGARVYHVTYSVWLPVMRVIS